MANRTSAGSVALLRIEVESRVEVSSSYRGWLVAALAETIAARELSQMRAAKLLRTDQPTLSKLLRGRTHSVSLDKLVDWLLILGRPVEITIGEIGPVRDEMVKAAADG